MRDLFQGRYEEGGEPHLVNYAETLQKIGLKVGNMGSENIPCFRSF